MNRLVAVLSLISLGFDLFGRPEIALFIFLGILALLAAAKIAARVTKAGFKV